MGGPVDVSEECKWGGLAKHRVSARSTALKKALTFLVVCAVGVLGTRSAQQHSGYRWNEVAIEKSSEPNVWPGSANGAAIELKPGSNASAANVSYAPVASANSWSQGPGLGLDMMRLNQCLEKHVRWYLLGEKGLDQRFPQVPLMSDEWNNYGRLFSGGNFGNGTTWAVSESKRLAYLILPKVGSMTFRTELAVCNPENGVPCDVLNSKKRPFCAEDAGMSFKPGGGFFKSSVLRVPVTPGGELKWSMTRKSVFAAAIERSVPFTFVTDPISKFIGGYTQVFKYKGPSTPAADAKYRQGFIRYCNAFLSARNQQRNNDPHFAPQLYYMYTAAIERTSLVRERDPDVTFAAPFAFVGRLDRENAQQDWESVVDILAEIDAAAARLVNRTLIASNGAREFTLEEKKELAELAKRAGLHTLVREVEWMQQHFRAKRALGSLAKPATWPKRLTQRFCAAFFVEYSCFGLELPKHCRDEAGNYDFGGVRPRVRSVAEE